MSHAATNWAIQQRGLKPTTRIVLWHLCDRFNPDHGCFPSQEQLAHDCEISRSTLNEHLALLEAAGLVRRIQRLHPGTRRQMPTRYILGFEPGFAPDDPSPCPQTGHGRKTHRPQSQTPSHLPSHPAQRCAAQSVDNSVDNPVHNHSCGQRAVSGIPADPCPEIAHTRVRNPDSNLVREPVREPVKVVGVPTHAAICEDFFARLRSALGLDPAALPARWQGWPAREHVRRWRNDPGLSEEAILAVAKETRRDHPEPPDGPKALDHAMQRAAQRLAERGVR